MRWLGRFSNEQTVRFLWNTQQIGGASVTRSTNGSIRVYKGDALVQRTSSSGITDTEDFDGLTGLHLTSVDLSNNAHAGFYTLEQYQVVLEGATVGGVVCNVAIAHFEITHATDGGEIGSPDNPDPGGLPADQPQVFVVIEEPLTGEILYTFAESYGGPFSDRTEWFGGYKEARILSAQLSPRQYGTAGGGLQATSWRIVLDDTDRFFRRNFDGLVGSPILQDKKATLYVIDHPNRIAEDEPYRVIAGYIVNHGAEPDFTYQIEIEGTLGRHSVAALTERMVPAHILTPAFLPALAARWSDGWPPPMGYGKLSDEDADTPQGVVPGVYLADINMQGTLGGSAANANVLAIGFFGSAIQDTLNLYYNDPGTPDVRSVVPNSEYGVRIIVPHKPFWTTYSGQAGQYLDFDGYRYTVAFISADIDPALADAIRDGRILISGNFNGIEEIGDGTGQLIEAPSRIFQHFWNNFVDRDYTTGDWALSIAAFGVYGVMDWERIEEAKDYSDSLIAGGLKGAILIGREGRQQSVFEVLKEMSASWDLEMGENHHGQIIADHEDPDAIPTIQLSDQHDAVQFRTTRDRNAYANAITYRYGYRYLPPTAPRDAPAEGEPLPATPIEPFGQWTTTSGLASGTAIDANNGRTVTMELDLYGVRDSATADLIAGRVLARAIRPVNVQFTTGWQGVGYNVSGEDLEIDLHTTVGITHVEGLGSPGFVEQPVRVRGVTVDPLRGLVTLEGRLL